MYIDTHCHLTFRQYNSDLPRVIGNAKNAGVKQMICVGVDEYSSGSSVDLARNNPGTVFASIGFHPYEASHNPDLSVLEALLKTMNREPKTIVAIGECGLDYHLFKGEKAEGKKQEQQMLFEVQLRLAAKYNLPVIMHVRDAYEDFFRVLDRLPVMPRGVIHCFSGGLEDLRHAQKRKLFIGVDGNVTYSKQLSLIVPHIPLNMMLLETDAPYLTPVPHRGTRNEPKYIPLIAAAAASFMHTKAETVMTETLNNSQILFNIPKP
jgi:TatD DNase family protein